MNMPQEDLAKLQKLRERVLNNEQVTRDELREGIEIARRWRSQPTATKAAKSKKAASPAVTMDDLNAMFAKIIAKSG